MLEEMNQVYRTDVRQQSESKEEVRSNQPFTIH